MNVHCGLFDTQDLSVLGVDSLEVVGRHRPYFHDVFIHTWLICLLVYYTFTLLEHSASWEFTPWIDMSRNVIIILDSIRKITFWPILSYNTIFCLRKFLKKKTITTVVCLRKNLVQIPLKAALMNLSKDKNLMGKPWRWKNGVEINNPDLVCGCYD